MLISREELREILNFSESQYELRVSMALDYIKQPEVAPLFINKMINHIKENKNFNQVTIREVFFKEIRGYLINTATCPNEFSFLKLANHLFMMSRFATMAIELHKQGKMLSERLLEPEVFILKVPELKEVLKEKPSSATVIKEMDEETPKPAIKNPPKKRKKKVLTPEQEAEKIRRRNERLARQAQVMREAKARKKAEQELNK